GFANSAGRILAGNNMDFDHRHFVHAQNFILIEILLLDAASIDGDAAFQRSAKTVHDAALDLLYDERGIHNVTAIDGADDSMNPNLPLIHRNFGNLRRKAAQIVHNSDSAESSRRQRFAPSGLFGCQIEYT